MREITAAKYDSGKWKRMLYFLTTRRTLEDVNNFNSTHIDNSFYFEKKKDIYCSYCWEY